MFGASLHTFLQVSFDRGKRDHQTLSRRYEILFGEKTRERKSLLSQARFNREVAPETPPRTPKAS